MENVPPVGKNIKVYFVEVDDDNRERVLSGIVEGVTISQEPEYADIRSDENHKPISRFMSRMDVFLERTRFIPDENGNYLKLEVFEDEPVEE